MADLAARDGRRSLLRRLRAPVDAPVTERRMYVTGGIGSSGHNEGFTSDYDLPNESAYAETCAAIGLVFWATACCSLTGEGRYADVMERALYNGVLSGVSLDGRALLLRQPAGAQPAATTHRQRLVRLRLLPAQHRPPAGIARAATSTRRRAQTGGRCHLCIGGRRSSTWIRAAGAGVAARPLPVGGQRPVVAWRCERPRQFASALRAARLVPINARWPINRSGQPTPW